jgi:hypothetical protein
MGEGDHILKILNTGGKSTIGIEWMRRFLWLLWIVVMVNKK